MEVSVGCAVEIYLGRSAGIVVEEMQLVIADSHVRNEFAVEGIVSHFRLSIL